MPLRIKIDDTNANVKRLLLVYDVLFSAAPDLYKLYDPILACATRMLNRIKRRALAGYDILVTAQRVEDRKLLSEGDDGE